MIVICIMCLLLFSTCIINNYALDTGDLVIVILSQPNKYHATMAQNSRHSIQNQVKILDEKYPVIYLSHIDFPHVGDWTIIPLLQQLALLHAGNSSWFIFVEDRTKLILDKLLSTLNKYSKNQDIWLGHALHDEEATIIHHFVFYKNPKFFKYPNMASGFAMSTKLLQKLADRLTQNHQKIDFNIDSAHELAMYIWNEGVGTKLTHEPSFCVTKENNCSTIPQPFIPCSSPVPTESIYFAVKTCSKFHEDRVPVVKKTWAAYTSKLNFFSDSRDESIPTITLGIPNTDSGHCGKSMAILQYSAKQLRKDNTISWVVLADDDTLFSISRLRQLLTCYDSTLPIALGERYGYNVHKSEGYNYVTGGGGIVFSRTMIELLVEPGVCECPTISSPDDMYLGICIAKLGVNIIHSPFFHQARPVDYPKNYLKTQMAVSFHKHWMIDPFFVYKNWLEDGDSITIDSIGHTEL